MKFLVDVNASGALVVWLRDMGHDVVAVSDFDPKMNDDDILNWAIREQRVIITTDNDFEQIIWLQSKRHCGVLRLENVPRIERKALLEDALNFHSEGLADGAIVIALKSKFRIRRQLSE